MKVGGQAQHDRNCAQTFVKAALELKSEPSSRFRERRKNLYRVHLESAEFPAQANEVILETTIGSILRERTAQSPGTQAFSEAACEGMEAGQPGRSVDYSQLLREAEQLAVALLSRYRPGERIAVWAPNQLEWIVLVFAAALSGLTIVTINPSSQARELRFVLSQSRAVGLFTVGTYRGNPMWRVAADVTAELPQVREIVNLSDRSALYRGSGGAAFLPLVDPSDSALIIYTSGTTGTPKGVVLTHRGITNNGRLVLLRIDPPREAPVVTAAPLFHVGTIMLLLGCIHHGSPLILLQLFDPDQILDVVEHRKAGVVTGVPTMFLSMLEQQETRPRNVSSLKRTLCGAATIAPTLIRRMRAVFGCNVQVIYGQTECSGVLTQTHVLDSAEDISETVGQPLPMTEVSVRDPLSGAPLATDEIGEICARGYGVMREYNDNPDATKAATIQDGWHRTGDLGAMDSRGYLRITGRLKDMIIRGGENIYPAEIENVLLEHPDVAEVAVVGIPDDRWGEIACCFVRTRSGGKLNELELIQHCRARISPQKTPGKWIAIDEWPLTASGKIQKFVLRDMVVKGKFQS